MAEEQAQQPATPKKRPNSNSGTLETAAQEAPQLSHC